MPLIETVIGNFRAAGVGPLVVIVNEQEREVPDWVRARFAALDAEFIGKPTGWSIESFRGVVDRAPAGRMLVSTVDAWCREADFVRFVKAALRRPEDATVLAVTPLVADENPLRVDLDGAGRVLSIGGPSGELVTAGMYLVSARARSLRPPAGLGRLREFLAWLPQAGEPVYGGGIETVVDLDRPHDVTLAAAPAPAGR